MPLDILEEIFCTLDPASLVNVSRTTKAFRQLLLSPSYAHVWREAFTRDESDIPHPPDGMQAKNWALLLFGGKTCEVCYVSCCLGITDIETSTYSIATSPTLRMSNFTFGRVSARAVSNQRTSLYLTVQTPTLMSLVDCIDAGPGPSATLQPNGCCPQNTS